MENEETHSPNADPDGHDLLIHDVSNIIKEVVSAEFPCCRKVSGCIPFISTQFHCYDNCSHKPKAHLCCIFLCQAKQNITDAKLRQAALNILERVNGVSPNEPQPEVLNRT